VAEEKFDPYHAWLGIPAWDRPVNAYRLLGLEVFEENRKVIEAAANRQMAYLQELSSGDEHIDLAQKLLGQISRARVVLLNPEKKIAYDQKLNAQLDTAPETAATSDDYGLTVPSGAKPRAEGTARANKSHPFYLRLIRPAIFMLVGLAVILTALAIRKKPTTVRVYEDKDGNGSYDKGEGVAEMNVEGFATSADGSVSFSLPAGTKELRPVTESTKYNFVRAIPQEVSIGRFSIWGPNVEIQVREKPKFTVAGRIYGKDRNGKKEGISASVHVDLNADDIAQNGEPQQTANKQGKFSFTDVRFLADANVKPQLIVSFSRSGFYRRIDPVPIHAEDFKEGAIEIPVELKRKQITISGVISILPKGELAEGITVYIDRDANQQPDAQEPKTQTDKDGNYKLRIPFFKADITKIEVRAPNASEYAPATFHSVNKSIDLADEDLVWDAANFLLRKLESPKQEDSKITVDSQESRPQGNTTAAKPITNQTDGNPQTTDTPANASENNETESNAPPIIPTPESDSAGFLRNLGFEGEEPQEGSDTKPEWTFQTDPSVLVAFTNAKRDYDKAAKKQNWNKIPKLNSDIQNIDGQIEKILTGAKTEAQTKRAQQQVQPFNAAREQLNAELNQLKQSRNALLTPLVMAAEAIGEEQEMYNESVVKQEQVKKAEENLGVSVQPLTKKQNAAWQPALKFLAEDKLRSLGLQKQGRKWTPTGVAQAADLFVTLKQYLSKHFSEYVKLKQQVNALISQNAVANQSKIEKLQQQITNQTGWKTYRDAKKEFNSGVKKYLVLLNKLQSQREELENNKEAIEKALTLLGGKYKVVIKQYPSIEQIEQKKALIAKWQSLIE